jgi:uncharacterized membrane protein YjgN (DUF898 family)
MSLKYTGAIGKLYWIWFTNLMLQFITLYIYRPWAKTKIRKYFYSNIFIFGDRLEYSGTGRELFKGYAQAILYLMILSAIISTLIAIFLSEASFIDAVMSYIPIMALLYYAQYSSLRYRFSRTRWRGIRASISGSGLKYMGFRLGRALINIITLGFSIGKSDLMAKRYLIEDSFIGSVKFKFLGNVSDLNRVNAVTIILALPTLFISRFWYIAALKKYVWNHLNIGSVSFHADFTGSKILRLFLGNIFILAFTLGFGMPIILQRSVKFFTDNIQIIGTEQDLDIFQAPDLGSAAGDGLEGITDDGLDLDIGIW